MLNWAEKAIRAADAKEVGVGNPAEETYRRPNQITDEKSWIAALLSTVCYPRRREHRFDVSAGSPHANAPTRDLRKGPG
jgi:hypothetical protein